MRIHLATLALGLLIATAIPADAQYFGRNKVQYGGLDFKVLETPHFDIYYSADEQEAVVDAGRLAERWYARLSRTLGHTFRERQPIVLYGSQAQFSRTTVVPGVLPDGVGGLTEHQRGRVVLPFAAGLGETDHVLGHELVHAFQRDILQRNKQAMGMLPLWYLEGMAEYLSVGYIDSNTAMWLRDSVSQNQLPTLKQLSDPRWFPYRYGQAFWVYLASRFGDDVIGQSLRADVKGGAVGRIAAVTHEDSQTLSNEWHAWIREVVAVPEGQNEVADSSTPIIKPVGDSRLNVGPALSPDGRSLVFLSERERYSIDVYLADAVTGAITRRIIRTAGDPHFDSLQFIGSAGAWDAEGRRFVLATLQGESSVLTILSMPAGDVEQEIRVSDLDQIFNPTWAPDGKQIAFGGLNGGMSDLYVVDVESGELRQLTHDPFADLAPAWSPDGRTIAFSTDRFSSSLETLQFGTYGLAALDVASGAVRSLPQVPDAHNIDPQWSADGKSLYVVADANQVNNVYQVDIETGEYRQVTHVATGVSGITATSPALSFSPETGRLAFSVYQHGAYEIHTMDAGAERPESTPTASSAAVADPGLTVARATPGVSTSRLRGTRTADTPEFALPDGNSFTVKPYKRGLSLNGLGQPYLSVGGGSLGGGFRAGMSLTLGDMLGGQQVFTTLQVGKSWNEFATQVAYANVASRWQWGVVGGQIPWLSGGSRTFVSTPTDGSAPTISRESVIFRQIHRQVSGAAIYPFSRVRRLEVRGGFHAIAFDRQVNTNLYSLETRRLIDQFSSHDATASGVAFAETAVALVYDTALVGPTSPILGQRYRFEVAPTLGDLQFTTVTLDYRRYLMPVRPFTLALRVKHLGRYGAGAGDARLLPIVWTLRDTVRGYTLDTLTRRPCVDVLSTECGSTAYLRTNRMAVANAELRFPIVGALRHSSDYGPIPIEGLAFVDSGLFWMNSLLPGQTTTGVQTSLFSAGAGVRLNAAGMVFEVTGVRRLGRTVDGGWTAGFNIRQGF